MMVFVIALVLVPLSSVRAQTETPPPEVTAQDLINWANNGRMAAGLSPLKVNSILMGTAQSTAEIMAANNMTGHIGDVRGRVRAAGYGVGDTPWATENFIMGRLTLESLSAGWADPEHQIPFENPNYCDIGVGIATAADGTVYYVLHAAYTDYHYCSGKTGSSTGKITPKPGTAAPTLADPLSQYIFAVHTLTPQSNGWVIHTVRQGQSLWSIAEAYGVKQQSIIDANALSADNPTIYAGQKLYIQVSYKPPTPTLPVTATPPILTAEPTLTKIHPSTASSAVMQIVPTAAPIPAAEEITPDKTVVTILLSTFGVGFLLMALGIKIKR